MKLLRDYPARVFLGINDEGESTYFVRPEWECDWYWGFGYLRSRSAHYHLDGLAHAADEGLYAGMLAHFPEKLQGVVTDDKGAVYEMTRCKKLWEFCELVATVYTLKETAEVLGRGGSRYSENPCRDVVMNKDEVARINNVVIPRLIDEIYVVMGVVEPLTDKAEE